MKRTNLLLMMCLMALVAFNFLSCSKDDDDKDNKNSKSLVGCWANDDNPYEHGGLISDPPTSLIGEILGGGSSSSSSVKYYEDFVVFEREGTCIEMELGYDKDMKQKNLSIYLGTYQVSKKGDTFIVKIIDEEDGSADDRYIKIDGNSMTVNEVGESETGHYHRIERSEIEHYLAATDESGNPDDIVGTWQDSYAEVMGDYALIHYYVFKNDGSMRDYLLRFRYKPDYPVDSFAWSDDDLDDYEFVRSEYTDYEWKVSGMFIYYRPKKQSYWDIAIYDVKDYSFILFSYYENKFKGFLRQFDRADEAKVEKFLKNAKKAS